MRQCYLCGANLLKNVNRSKDHIPPDCFFPTGTQSMVTVPCCITCNNQYQRLDEKMRNFIATLSTSVSTERIEKGRRTISKDPGMAREYLSYTKSHPTLVTADGQPRLLSFFDNEELTSWLSRIVKGLFFHENRRRINDEAVFTVKPMPEIRPPPSATFPFDKGLERRPYFVYGVVQDHNKPNRDFWVLVFYDQIVFSVTVEIPT
jgi:hypothetical protein